MKAHYLFKFLVVFLISMSFRASIQAQDFENIKSWDTYLSATENANSIETLKHLAFDNVPTLYWVKGSWVNTAQTTPIRVITAASNLDLISKSNKLFDSIEMVVLKVSGPADIAALENQKLALNENFQKLSYVLFIVEMKMSEAELENLFSSLSVFENVQLFYQVSIPN